MDSNVDQFVYELTYHITCEGRTGCVRNKNVMSIQRLFSFLNENRFYTL